MKNKIHNGDNLAPEVINPLTKSGAADSIEGNSPSGVIILCDHASNFVPDDLDDLGLGEQALSDHIAWDIGAEKVTRMMCEMMGATAVIQKVSRLVIDVNREPDRDSLIPVISDGIHIPGNRGLAFADTSDRVDRYYTPFHQAAEQAVTDSLDQGVVPLLIGMHSFTPEMQGQKRPWEIGFLWNKDPRLAQAMIGMLERETDLTIGDNQPYSGQDLYYTMQRHGADRGVPQTTVEIRQDLLTTEAECRQWAALMCDVLDELLSREDVRAIKHY